jgi:hypothetical protein
MTFPISWLDEKKQFGIAKKAIQVERFPQD